MLKCKDCEKYYKTKDENNGICSLPGSFFPTNADNICPFLKIEKLHCKNCTHFGSDFACMTREENDEICGGFVNIEEEQLENIIFDMIKRNIDVKEKILEIIDEVQNSDYVQFLNNHKNDIIEK